MKTTFLLPAILFAAAVHADPAAMPVRIQTLPGQGQAPALFPLPTIAGDKLKLQARVKEGGGPQFEELSWCQIEFYPAARALELQKKLQAYHASEKTNREEQGWREAWVRTMKRGPVLAGKGAVKELAAAVDGKVLAAPVLRNGDQVLGQVEGGYSIKLPEDGLLYGRTDGKRGDITSLCAIVKNSAGNAELNRTFITLSNRSRLVLVDWRGQLLLLKPTEGNRKVMAWRPED